MNAPNSIRLAGLGLTVAPVSAQAAGANPVILYGSLALLLVIGLVLSYKAYFGTAA